MNASRGWAFVFLLVSPLQVQAADQFLTDSLGDRLPDGAIARLGTTRLRLRHDLNCLPPRLLFAPSGNQCVSFGYRRGLQVWDCGTGKDQPFLKDLEHADCAVFSGDGKLAAAGTTGISVWNFATGKKISDTGGDFDGLAMVFKENGEVLVFVDWQGVVRWWDVAKCQVVQEWKPLDKLQWPKNGVEPPPNFLAAAFSPDGRTLVAHLAHHARSRSS